MIVGLNPCFNGLNYHDPSVVFMDAGHVVFAAEEERFTRRKAHGVLPIHAFRYGLESLGISANDIEHVAVGYEPTLREATEDQPVSLIQALRLTEALELPGVPVRFIEHHRAHAQSAFTNSGFGHALVFVNDGVGEHHASTIWVGKGRELIRLQANGVFRSLGYFYALVTAALGFRAWKDEGLVMALAPYGAKDPWLWRYLDSILMRDGSVSVEGAQEFLVRGLYFDFEGAGRWLARQVAAAGFGECAQQPTQANVAMWAQERLEEQLVREVNTQLIRHDLHHACFAGGVHFNCKLNGKIARSCNAECFFDPVAGDAGTALGAAYSTGSVPPEPLSHLYLGYELSDDVVASEVSKALPRSHMVLPTAPEQIVQRLMEGGIIIWATGRAEFGPRALCHRSLLAVPNREDVRLRLNEIVKDRAPWRPFGPVVTRKAASRVLARDRSRLDGRFMIESFSAGSACDSLCGAMHPRDHSVRVQILDDESDRLLQKVLRILLDEHGIPGLINTSLNGRDEPICNTERDVVSFFSRTEDVSCLVTHSRMFERRP